MNKMRFPKFFMLLLAVSLGFGACNNNKTNPRTDPIKLATPANLSIIKTEKKLTWTAVQNAIAYTVDIDGKENNATSTIYSLSDLPHGTYQIRVMANGDGETYADSDWSDDTSYVNEPTVFYDLPEELHVEVEVRNETGWLDVITKETLAFIDQVKVTDPADGERHYISYSLADILAHMEIFVGFGSALIEASDDPAQYNTTITGVDNAYIAVVRMITDTGEIQTTSKFPRFFVDGDEDTVISSVGTITLTGGTPPTPLPPDPPPSQWQLVDPPYVLPGSLEVNIKIYGAGTLLGTIEKDTLANIAQVLVIYTDSAERDYVSYPLVSVLAKLGIAADGFSHAEGASRDGYDVIGAIDDSYITVLRYNSDGTEMTNGEPRFLAPNGVRGVVGGGDSLAARDAVKITLLKE